MATSKGSGEITNPNANSNETTNSHPSARRGFGWPAIVLAAVLPAAAVAGFGYRQMRRLEALTLRSPLPAVSLAPGGPALGARAYRCPYDFTADWFTGHVPAWRAAMAPLAGRPGVRYLEVGVYEGRSAIWMLENVLTHPTSRAVVIDPFLVDGTEGRWRANLEKSGESSRVESIKGLSGDVLPGLKPSSFDVIYIDGSHATAEVLSDAVLSWRLLKPGGLLIFDDYHWAGCDSQCGGDAEADFPKRAIDAFCACYAPQLEVVHNDYQMMVRKKGR